MLGDGMDNGWPVMVRKIIFMYAYYLSKFASSVIAHLTVNTFYAKDLFLVC